ncbi:MAG: reprolysin-like metallopeptidase [Saprospiraceae bacterium]
MLKNLLCCLFLLLSSTIFSQNIWSDVSEKSIPVLGRSERLIVPSQYRAVRLDLAAVQPLLAAAPERFRPNAGPEQDIVLTLPLPDGRWGRFRITESPVMAPEIQARFPEIRCYTGTGLDDPTASLKCDLTPQGFHAMISSPHHDPIFIDPYQRGDREHCVVYNKKNLEPKEPYACTLDEAVDMPDLKKMPVPEMVGDCQFRKYRLALACTGEYANFHGGTVPLVLAAMNTTMNRVNGIYERDLSVTMQIIANNDLLVYLDPVTDGYSNGNGSSMLNQNQTKCNNIIGSANYDIGHVFSTGGGGIAGVGVVCNNSTKARGVTGRNQPIGDPFNVDYVSHEMGHQFNGNHTQNNNCGRYLPTAMEPGSASTIMGYAGICSPNIQANSDPYFHAVNLQEISGYITTGPGNVCPVKTNTGNTAPVVNAGTDYVIPHSTPFSLTAVSTDIDGDALTYCWEQMNNEVAPMPPQSTNTGGPAFRSLNPMPSPTRYFPRLADLATGTDPIWERLPGVARTMNFRVTVRDNKSTGGCTGEDNMVLTVAGTAGPFVVTAPNTAQTWYVAEKRNVTWNVAATDVAPVSCSMVRLLLSTDGGLTYPIVLANSVPNTGTAEVEVPNEISATCRVMVQAIGNVFFDISDQNFAIEVPLVPTFFMDISANPTEQACTGQTLLFSANIAGSGGFTMPVTLSVSGAPSNAAVSISDNPVMPGNSANIALANLNQTGVFNITVTAESDTIIRTFSFDLTVVDAQPQSTSLSAPTDGATNLPLKQALTWASIPGALTYQVEVAVNPAFGAADLVLDQTTSATTTALSGLQEATVYYWRVRVTNACGVSDFSPVFAFQTGQPECSTDYASVNVPIAIPATSTALVTSNLNMPDDGVVAKLRVSLKIDHEWVGDLAARLVSPDGTSARLFDHPGFPAISSGCNGRNLELEFDDAALLTAANFENTCNDTPAISGIFQSIDALSRFNNASPLGTWKLEVADIFPEDGGSIVEWGLSICYFQAVPPTEILVNSPLTLASGSTKTLTISNLVLKIDSGNPADGVFTLLAVPNYGALVLNGSPLVIGDMFTQADILSGALAYVNSGDTATADTFVFDVTDASTNGWVHGAIFNIIIVQNDLNANATVTQPLVCSDAATAQITVQVSGGTPPLQFSLDGGAGQFINVFGGLAAGMYTVVVTDDYGFTAQTSVTVGNPPALDLTATSTNDDIFAQANSGLPPFEYSLDGQAFQTNPFFENLPNGNYTVTVRDANGCTGTATTQVYVGPLLFQLVDQTHISCFGGTDGSLTAFIIGGVAPYSYSLNGVDFQPANTFAGLGAGQYTVVVKDDSGNTASELVTLTQPPVIAVAVAVFLNSIEVTASGGTGTLEYSLDGMLFQPENTFGGLANGDYTVTVRDTNGCTVTRDATVAVPPLTIVSLNVSGEISCSGQTVSVLVSASGGVPPLEFSLDGGPYQTDSLFKNVGGGMHQIQVRDAAGMAVPALSFNVSEPDPVSVTAVVVARSATITGAGGIPPYQYALNSGTLQDSGEFPNLPNGTYQATVTDANGCTVTVDFEVNYVALSTSVSATDPSCADGTDGIILLEVLGGTPPFVCSVNGGPCNLADLAAGTYNVVVTDALGDSTTKTVVLTDPPALQIAAGATNDTITAIASGGTGMLEYSLNGTVYQASPQFSGLPNGIYTVFVRDENGCTTESDSVLVDYVGTVSPEQAWGLSIQPNPSDGRFLLTLRNAPLATFRTDVFDTSGRLLFQQKHEPAAQSFSTSLDLTGFPAGTYTLRLVSGNQVGAVRIVVY